MGTLQNAKILLAVQRLGSISKAAQELNISQPTVSVILKKIESEVEGDIYYHNERPIKREFPAVSYSRRQEAR